MRCDAGFPKKGEEMTEKTKIQYEAKKGRDGTVRIFMNVLPPRPAGNEFTNQCCTPLL